MSFLPKESRFELVPTQLQVQRLAWVIERWADDLSIRKTDLLRTLDRMNIRYKDIRVAMESLSGWWELLDRVRSFVEAEQNDPPRVESRGVAEEKRRGGFSSCRG